MAKKITLEFIKPPNGLTKVIQQAGGVCETAAQQIAARASSISPTNAPYTVYTRQIKFGQDNIYGVSRPAAVVETADDETLADEAENKTLLKAVGKL